MSKLLHHPPHHPSRSRPRRHRWDQANSHQSLPSDRLAPSGSSRGFTISSKCWSFVNMSKRTGEESGEEAVAKKSHSQLGDPLNMMQWIEENKSSFLPPVCNKLMWVSESIQSKSQPAILHAQFLILQSALKSIFFILVGWPNHSEF